MNNRQRHFSNDSAHDLSFLYSRDVTDLIHFTHLGNLPGILDAGLLPRASLEQMGAQYAWSDDLRLDGKNAVNLSITNPNIKMFYGKRKELSNTHYFVVLTLDPALLSDAEGSYEFRRDNAAGWDSQPSSVEDLFAGNRPTYFEPSWTTLNQAEVRVMGRIDPRRIKTIQFPFDYYNRLKLGPSEQPWPDFLAGLAKELDLPLEVVLCDRLFHYYLSPLGQQYEQKRRFECRVIHTQKKTRHAAGNGKATDGQTSKWQDELGGRLVQESDAIQRAAAKLTVSAEELSKNVARLETKVTDASRVTATAKGEATKAEKFHRRAATLLESTQEAIHSIEASVVEMQAACTTLARESETTGQRDRFLLERIESLESTIRSRDLALFGRIEQLESTIGRIDRNTQKGFGKERG